MQPYQRATEEIIRQGEAPLSLAKTAGQIGSAVLTGYTGSSIAGRVLPMLSKYIPQELAIKGLNKIDPRFGKFVNKAMSGGQTFDSIRDFLEEKAQEGLPAKQSGNIIEQESPELHKFLDQEIKKGRKPIEAAAIAQNDKKFSNIINKLMKSHKTPWSSIVESIFGSGDMALPQQEQKNPMQQQMQQQGDPQAKQNLAQAMQTLAQALRQ
jgi:hypothetical protein